MSDVQPRPELPREPAPTTESGESGGFYVVVGGSGEEELPPATESEGELDPASERLAALEDVAPEAVAAEAPAPGDLEDEDPEPPFEDSAEDPAEDPAEDLDDGSSLELTEEREATEDFEPDSLDDVPDALFASDVTEFAQPDALESDEGLGAEDGEAGGEFLERHPDYAGESPFGPLEPAAEPQPRPRPPAAPGHAPLRHGRRRDEFFSGSGDYQRQPPPAAPPSAAPKLRVVVEPREAGDPDPHAVGGPLRPVDARALPAYVLEQLDDRARRRAEADARYHRAHRAEVARVAVALAVAFAVFGQLHGWLSLLGGKGLLLLPWDALLGAGCGVLLSRAPNTLRGQLYVGAAAALAMGTKFAWVVPSGALEGLSLLISFVCSAGCMFGAVIGGGVLGLSLEQRLVE